MRFKLAVFLVSLLLTLSTGVTAAVGLAAAGPLHAGDPFFPFQDLAEQGVAALTQDDYNYAAYRMDLLDRRTRDLDYVAGSQAELKALDSLRWELEQSINGLTYLSEEQLLPLRERLVKDLTAIQLAFPKLKIAPQQVPDQWAALQSYVADLLARASDFNQPISALVFEPNVTGFVLKPGAAVSSLNPPGQVSPRQVTFPKGSAGAMHTFFPLEGRHAEIECAACHTNGRYAGTPVNCTACHSADAPDDHFPGECALCHSTSAWKPATFNHKAVDTSNCASCHTSDKPANHFEGECSLCHNYAKPGSRPILITWAPARTARPVTPRINPPTISKASAPCATLRRPGSRPTSTTRQPRRPIVSPAIPKTSLPTTSRASARCVTAPPPGSRPPSAIPTPATTAPPATPRTNPPITSPGSARCATAPARGNRPISTTSTPERDCACLPHQGQTRQPLRRAVLVVPQFYRLETGDFQPSGYRRERLRVLPHQG